MDKKRKRVSEVQPGRDISNEEATTHRDGGKVALGSESGHVGVIGSGVDHVGIHRPSRVPLRERKEREDQRWVSVRRDEAKRREETNIEDSVHRRPSRPGGSSEESTGRVEEEESASSLEREEGKR